jgi:polar amino acid transport system substrate-binding protein
MRTARLFNAISLSLGIALSAVILLAPSRANAQGATLDRIKSTGTINFGYYPGARPITYDNNGKADGFAVAVCREIASAVGKQLSMPSLSTRFVAEATDPVAAVKSGSIDLMCGPMQPTIARRQEVSFSIPVFPSGIGVMYRNDAPADFRKLIEGNAASKRPVWRGSPQVPALDQRRFVVVSGTAAERFAAQRKRELNVTSVIVPVPDVQTALQRLSRGEADAFLGDRSVLLDLAHNDPAGKGMLVGARAFDVAYGSLALQRGDEDFRLAVDRALSGLYASGRIDAIYGQYLGKPDMATREWYRHAAEPD